MASFFYTPVERRYAQFPRRYLVEYHVDARRKEPISKGSCATLFSARKHASAPIELGFCTAARIFDRKIGQYVFTYKGNSRDGYNRYEGNVR